MFGCWKIFYFSMRRNFLLSYNATLKTKSLMGILCRFWSWLNYASKDEEVIKKIEWKFDINETIQLNHFKEIGIICFRWIRFGHKLYEVKFEKRYGICYESEIKKTNLRIYSKVKIQEIKFKTLKEGHYCSPTKRWIPTRHYQVGYSNLYARPVIKQL